MKKTFSLAGVCDNMRWEHDRLPEHTRRESERPDPADSADSADANDRPGKGIVGHKDK